ncbi:MAG: hypothetical protein PVH52_01390 [bacterium]
MFRRESSGTPNVIPALEASAEESEADKDQALIDAVAEKLVKKHLTVPAIFFLESSKPLAFLGGQLLIFLEPFVQTLFNFEQYQRFAILMEDRDSWEKLVRKIEDLEADYSEKEKQAKAAEKQARAAKKKAREAQEQAKKKE